MKPDDNSPTKLIYRFKTIPIKILAGFCCRNWEVDPKIYVEMQIVWKFWKKNQAGGLTLPDI